MKKLHILKRTWGLCAPFRLNMLVIIGFLFITQAVSSLFPIEGRIVGQGSHDELLASNEFYQRLVQNQVIMA